MLLSATGSFNYSPASYGPLSFYLTAYQLTPGTEITGVFIPGTDFNFYAGNNMGTLTTIFSGQAALEAHFD